MKSNRVTLPGEQDKPAPALVAIIEDNSEIANLYAMLIEARGMQISFIARDGREAVAAFMSAREPPDVLLIDHRMPVMSGLDAMKNILAVEPGARFIFISADEGIRDEALAAGAKAFLRKPASVSQILDAMTLVLDDGRR